MRQFDKTFCVKIDHNSVLLIETLLRQGLINPMDMDPHLLALQGHIGQPGIRAIALKLLTEENQKRIGNVIPDTITL